MVRAPTRYRPGTDAVRVTRSRPWSYDFAGVVVAVLSFALSMTPSLLPRSWVFQGVVSGLAVVAGYAVGVQVGRVVRHVVPATPGPRLARMAWRVVAVVGPAFALLYLYLGVRWQQDLHLLVRGRRPSAAPYLGTPVLTLGLAMVVIGVARAVRRLSRRVAHHLGRWVPPRVAGVVSVLLVAVLVVGILDGVVRRAFVVAADSVSRVTDEATAPGVTPPDTPLRSGGPGSLLSWDDLGSKGREFVAGGPTAEQLEAFSGQPATEPVRVYAGLGSAETIPDRAELAVAELERTGGFERAVLAVLTPTGTGWVNPTAADALDYLYNGDTALVSLQYSYLPSWLSVLVDPQRAREAGQELFDVVNERWAELPEDRRPELVVFGESLGSHGAEEAFSGLADVRNRTDGMLLVGPMNSNRLWADLTAGRDPGSPERLPVVDSGHTVRFAATSADLDRPGGSWPRPRVVYLQHPTDPVVWWSPDLVLRRPDWLREPPGEDGLPSVRWFPGVTFLQLTVDLAHRTPLLDGYGHKYDDAIPAAWAAVVPPPGWTADDTARLERVLADQAAGPAW